MQVWILRSVNVLAITAAVLLLVVDSPMPNQLAVYLSRTVVEAVPLLLGGVALVVWLAIDRPPLIDFIKQAFIAVAFILWGMDLLMPAGRWATFVGAVVIAIYVFDLAWMIEGNLRKKLTVHATENTRQCISTDCRPGGACGCQADLSDKTNLLRDHLSALRTAKH